MRPRRVIALACMLIALVFGASHHRAALAEVGHLLHGDIAVSDGGWVVADCADDHAPCGDGGVDSHGHHHHAADHSGVSAVSLSTPLAMPVRMAQADVPPPANTRSSDADLARQGPVPRISQDLI